MISLEILIVCMYNMRNFLVKFNADCSIHTGHTSIGQRLGM